MHETIRFLVYSTLFIIILIIFSLLFFKMINTCTQINVFYAFNFVFYEKKTLNSILFYCMLWSKQWSAISPISFVIPARSYKIPYPYILIRPYQVKLPFWLLSPQIVSKLEFFSPLCFCNNNIKKYQCRINYLFNFLQLIIYSYCYC